MKSGLVYKNKFTMNFLLATNKSDAPENGEWMFRMESVKTTNGIILEYDVYGVSSKTPKGVWIVPCYVDPRDTETIKEVRRFVRKGGKKRFAYETKQLAKIAFYHRKKSQIRILQAQLKNAEEAYNAVGGKILPSKYSILDYI